MIDPVAMVVLVQMGMDRQRDLMLPAGTDGGTPAEERSVAPRGKAVAIVADSLIALGHALKGGPQSAAH